MMIDCQCLVEHSISCVQQAHAHFFKELVHASQAGGISVLYYIGVWHHGCAVHGLFLHEVRETMRSLGQETCRYMEVAHCTI